MITLLFQPPQKYRSIATKVVIQMAAKLKGIPWTVKNPVKNLMVVGFDTYHDKEGDRRGSSVGALVKDGMRVLDWFFFFFGLPTDAGSASVERLGLSVGPSPSDSCFVL
jgi:hypothetical protein